MSIFTQNLVTTRKQRGMTQEQLAEKVGVSKNTFMRWEAGKYLPNIVEAEKLATALNISLPKLLGVSVSELLDETPRGIGESNVRAIYPLKLLPVYKLSACAGAGQCALEDDRDVIEQWLVPPDEDYEPKTHFCVKVSGVSMTPTLNDEDIVVVQRAEFCDRLLRVGEIVLIKFCGDNFIRYVKSISPDGIIFAPLNPKYQPITINEYTEPYELLGKIVAKSQSMEKLRSVFG